MKAAVLYQYKTPLKVKDVDLLDNKLEYAKQFGATHTINPGRQDLFKIVRSLTD